MVFLSPFRYFGSVNFIEGWYPGSKAASFIKYGSYANVSNVDIAVCNFTVAFWIRLFKPSHTHTITMGSAISGKSVALFAHSTDVNFRFNLNREVSVDTMSSTSALITAGMNSWIHIAATCEQDNKVRVYVNGSLFQSKDELFVRPLQGLLRTPKREYRIGNHVGQLIQMYGSLMDLHIIGFALPADKICDLFRGQKIVYQTMNYSFFFFSRGYSNRYI